MVPRKGRRKAVPRTPEEEGQEEIRDLLGDAADVTREFEEARIEANRKAVEAIRNIEALVVNALGNVWLRGMNNLLSYGRSYYGTRIDSESQELPKDGREVPVFSKNGRLVMARAMTGMDRPAWRDIADNEIRADWLLPYVRAVADGLGKHIVSADRKLEEYDRVFDLADRLREALGERE